MAEDQIKQLVNVCYRDAAIKGFWDNGQDSKPTKIALMHSELSEILEAVREGEDTPSEKIPPFTKEEEELADLLIRAFDYAGGFNLDVSAAIQAKLNYNRSRPYKHNKEF